MRHTYDVATILKDSGLVAATGNATVSAAAQILDVGDGALTGFVVLDVTAIEVADTNENFKVILQGSSSSTFASDIVNLAMIEFGALAALTGGPSAAPAIGRYEMGFSNVYAGTIYRYLRLRIVVAGTVGTGINFSAFLAPAHRFGADN